MGRKKMPEKTAPRVGWSDIKWPTLISAHTPRLAKIMMLKSRGVYI
jgi:hypothetical protein